LKGHHRHGRAWDDDVDQRCHEDEGVRQEAEQQPTAEARARVLIAAAHGFKSVAKDANDMRAMRALFDDLVRMVVAGLPITAEPTGRPRHGKADRRRGARANAGARGSSRFLSRVGYEPQEVGAPARWCFHFRAGAPNTSVILPRRPTRVLIAHLQGGAVQRKQGVSADSPRRLITPFPGSEARGFGSRCGEGGRLPELSRAEGQPHAP